MTGKAHVAATARPGHVIEIDIVHEAGNWDGIPDAERLVAAAAAAVGKCEAIGLGAMPTATIALGDNNLVQALNGKFRGRPKSTNVLSFPAPDNADGALGDIVFALETIEHEAADLGIPVAHHLQHLTVHGLLHLLGYDHVTDEAAEEMERLEIAILATLGIPDPYADSDPLPP